MIWRKATVAACQSLWSAGCGLEGAKWALCKRFGPPYLPLVLIVWLTLPLGKEPGRRHRDDGVGFSSWPRDRGCVGWGIGDCRSRPLSCNWPDASHSMMVGRREGADRRGERQTRNRSKGVAAGHGPSAQPRRQERRHARTRALSGASGNVASGNRHGRRACKAPVVAESQVPGAPRYRQLPVVTASARRRYAHDVVAWRVALVVSGGEPILPPSYIPVVIDGWRSSRRARLRL